VALITAAMSGAFPPAGSQALEVAPTAAVFMAAVDDIADRMYSAGRANRDKNGKEYHAAQDFDVCST